MDPEKTLIHSFFKAAEHATIVAAEHLGLLSPSDKIQRLEIEQETLITDNFRTLFPDQYDVPEYKIKAHAILDSALLRTPSYLQEKKEEMIESGNTVGLEILREFEKLESEKKIAEAEEEPSIEREERAEDAHARFSASVTWDAHTPAAKPPAP